jgi:hypothetical protein
MKDSTGTLGKQVIGINEIAAVPTKIAEFNNKSNPKGYTSHCFRRSGATMLAESGASLPVMKIAGSWKSSSVAEGYIAQSVLTKRSIAEAIDILDEKDENPSKVVKVANETIDSDVQQSSSTSSVINASNVQQFTMNNLSSCQFFFNTSPPDVHRTGDHVTFRNEEK